MIDPLISTECAVAARVLIQTHAEQGTPADLTLTLTKPQLLAMMAGAGMEGVQASGDQKVMATLVGLLDEGDREFDIVTP